MVGIFGFIILIIALHNQTVVFSSEVKQKAKIVGDFESANAQLKNSYYAALDTKALVDSAQQLGYVRDSNPRYISFSADGQVLQGGSTVSLR